MKVVTCMKVIKEELINQQSVTGEYAINPYDLYALNHILEFKNKINLELICVTMGGNQIKNALIKCYAAGVDSVMWLNDLEFSGADTIATTIALSTAINQIENYKLIICGEKACDGETGQIPPDLAQRLNMQYVSGVKKIIELTEEYIIVQIEDDNSSMVMKVKLPAVISFDEFATIMNNVSLISFKKAKKTEIPIYTAKKLGISSELCGLKGSKTLVVRTKANFIKKEKVNLIGTTEEKVWELVNILMRRDE